MRHEEWYRQINDDGDVILRGESGIAVNMRGDVDLADKIVNSVRYHDRLVEALSMFAHYSPQTCSTLPVECERAGALLAELSAHNGGEG